MKNVDARPAPTFNKKSFRDLFEICVLFLASLSFRQNGTVTRIVLIII